MGHSPKAITAHAVKEQARLLGLSACGIAKAGRVDAAAERHFRQWLAEGKNAGMAYMGNWLDKRLDPRLLMPGVRSIVSVAMNYAPAKKPPLGEPQIAAYALGQDYHDVLKKKLFQLAAFIAERRGGEAQATRAGGLPPAQPSDQPTPAFRVFVDSGPVLERYWAVKAGLGWIGHNRQLIIPGAGSLFFLGELFLDFELDYDTPQPNRCGHCHRCIDACPTGALAPAPPPATSPSPPPVPLFDAHLCLSYQTIENRGELSDEAKQKMGNYIYGCDRCQTACPWNRFARPNSTPELQPKDELLHMNWQKWDSLTIEEYRKLFKGSAVKRVKYEGLMRNIRAAEGKAEKES